MHSVLITVLHGASVCGITTDQYRYNIIIDTMKQYKCMHVVCKDY